MFQTSSATRFKTRFAKTSVIKIRKNKVKTKFSTKEVLLLFFQICIKSIGTREWKDYQYEPDSQRPFDILKKWTRVSKINVLNIATFLINYNTLLKNINIDTYWYWNLKMWSEYIMKFILFYMIFLLRAGYIFNNWK